MANTIDAHAKSNASSSRLTTGSTADPIDITHWATSESVKPPEGGFQAWLMVAGAFFVWFNSWGAINAFGVFQSYYQLDLLASYSPSEIACIGSVQNFLVLCVGFLSGPLYDAGYTPLLMWLGTALTILGTMMLSLAGRGQFYQVFLSQAVCVGLGWGLMFTPTASLPSRFFHKKLPLAMGIASAGTGIGGIVYSIAFSRLIQAGVGFPWATRMLGFLAIVTLAFSAAAMSTRARSPNRRSFIDWTAFREKTYIAYLIGGILTMTGIQVPYYYASLYAITTGVTSNQLGFYVVTVMNAGSFFGRLILPCMALQLGIFNMFILSYVGTFIVCFCFIAAHSSVTVFLVATFCGFFSGSLVALSPVTLARMTPDPALIGARMGMTFAISSIGVLAGTPISGAILEATGSFRHVWMFSGSCIGAGAVFMVVCRITMTEQFASKVS